MRDYLDIFLAVPLLVFVSCSGEEQPYVPVKYGVSVIEAEGFREVFHYNKEGLVDGWEATDTRLGYSNCKSSYEYRDNGVIAISADIIVDNERSVFVEELYLNGDGIAEYAKGTATFFNNSSEVIMKKNYTANFEYDSEKQLTAVDVSERRTNDTGWEEENPLKWKVELGWSEGNLTRYLEYSNPSHPLVERSYSYYGGETANFIPIVQGAICRYYYLPLQYQGVLGKQSVALVKDVTYSDNSVCQFEYTMAVSIHDSRVEAYAEKHNGEETEYRLRWQPI
ncbi:MAG: DUF4595 domain-containing protein [Muribaculaceae bacterium]|nr:DUF4595 domain-containing protein [Muribaculaceae bacterium]